jgi:hypothetical protein
VPGLKQSPDAKLLVMVGLLQLSVASGLLQVTFAQESKLFKTKLVGQEVNFGLIESVAQGLTTVMVKEQLAVLPFASFAV